MGQIEKDDIDINNDNFSYQVVLNLAEEEKLKGKQALKGQTMTMNGVAPPQGIPEDEF